MAWYHYFSSFWALCNLAVAFCLLKLGKVTTENILSTGIALTGFVLLSIWSSINFTKNDKAFIIIV